MEEGFTIKIEATIKKCLLNSRFKPNHRLTEANANTVEKLLRICSNVIKIRFILSAQIAMGSFLKEQPIIRFAMLVIDPSATYIGQMSARKFNPQKIL